MYLNRIIPTEPHEAPTDFRLRKTVFLGYTDVNAGGIRALLGIDMKKEYMDINVPALAGARLACVRTGDLDPREREFAPVQVWNLKYEQFSVILVNTALKPTKCHHVCSAIVDLCSRSCVKKLVVLSALRVDIFDETPQPIYENAINDLPFTKLPSIPSDALMNDAFLSTLIQMVRVDFVPSCFLVIPAHRACIGAARDDDGSKEVIRTFQNIVNAAYGISFDEGFSFDLVYQGEQTADTTLSMIYS
ncbi:uncharacterized protein LOC128203765 [Mya arenaria]|uniref:uncharacterized protein LOC128203765 n=1 Tax=Mya arenaria TaxID=6604 RepID=UPI0022E18358|nr:uncharacterized protein LOC128203765 [Mya arenaria]